MKRWLSILLAAALGCTFPVQLIPATPEAVPGSPAAMTPGRAPGPAPTLTPPATAQPGTEKNPLILALSPSAHPTDAVLAAGEQIAAFLESHTGYRVVSVVPPTESELVEAFARNNAHIASLSPFAYALARRNDSVTAALASVREGRMFYGAQFIAGRDSGFSSFYDAVRAENTADGAEALKQLEGKKPCWSDPLSPSGYVVPLGLLNQAGVQTRSGAFLEGQPSVVRAVYTADICDFGVTFIDARQSPALEADYPDVMDRVIVLWRVADIIPYENISFSSALPLEMRRVLQRAFIDLMLTAPGRAAVQTAYGIDELQIAEDAMYQEFEKDVAASKLDLFELVRQVQP